jgi:hypothetical protein
MGAPGSRAKRSSSSVKVRPRSLSSTSNILRSSSLSSWRAATRSGVSGGDGSSGESTAINAAAAAKVAGRIGEKGSALDRGPFHAISKGISRPFRPSRSVSTSKPNRPRFPYPSEEKNKPIRMGKVERGAARARWWKVLRWWPARLSLRHTL